MCVYVYVHVPGYRHTGRVMPLQVLSTRQRMCSFLLDRVLEVSIKLFLLVLALTVEIRMLCWLFVCNLDTYCSSF